jgi:type II secretory pathway pseudopilin PulG
MKPRFPSFSEARRNARPRPVAAFTLVEILIAMSVFLLLLGAILGANIFGLKVLTTTTNKLTATDQVRKAIGRMTDDIRMAKTTMVGTVNTNGDFAGHIDGEFQTGSGVMIYPSTNTNNFIVYYLNSSDHTFRRSTSVAGSTTILARSITNSLPFTAQDFSGKILTNNQNNRVIHLALEFYQARVAGPTADYYKLETSVTRRALE